MEATTENTQITDRIDYNFKCGIKAAQQEPTYKQDKKTLAILKRLEIGEVKDINDIQFAKILNLILEQDIVLELVESVLIEVEKPEGITFSELTRAEIIQVIRDFFTFSPELVKLFGHGKLAQALKPVLTNGTKNTTENSL